MKQALALVLFVSLVAPRAAFAQATPGDIARRSASAVLRLSGELTEGTAFVVDQDAGLLLTNAHVTAGQSSLTVQVDLRYKVAAAVVIEDRRNDVAVVRVSPQALRGTEELRLDPTGAEALAVGDPLTVMGYPLRRGVVTTTGIVSQVDQRVLMTDAPMNPGNSGGPVFGPDGGVVGVATFLAAAGTGPGIGGAVPAAIALRTLEAARLALSSDSPPADSLPVMPTAPFPIEVLEEAASAERWPLDLYDISSAGFSSGFDVRIFTPPVLARQSASGEDDLRYWALALGQYPPVVIIRIHPRVGQSTRGILANLLLGALSGATDTYFARVYDPAARGAVSSVTVQDVVGFVQPIEIKRAGGVLAGEPIQVVYVVLSAEMFRPAASGAWPQVVITLRIGIRVHAPGPCRRRQ